MPLFEEEYPNYRNVTIIYGMWNIETCVEFTHWNF